MIRFNLFYPKRVLQLAIPIVLSSFLGTCPRNPNVDKQKILDTYKAHIQNQNDISLNQYGTTIDFLYAAVSDGSLEKVRILLERISADHSNGRQYSDQSFPNSVDKASNDTALLKAIRTKKVEIAKVLIQHEQFTNSLTIANKEDTPLRLAIGNKLEVVAMLLINKLISIKSEALTQAKSSQDPETPLHLAVTVKANNIAKHLIEQLEAKDLSSRDKNGKTALHIAVTNKAIDVVKKLIEKQTAESLCIQDNQHNTALHIAIKNKLTDIAKQLITKIDAKKLMSTPRQVMPPLHIAIEEGNAQVVEALVSKLALNCRQTLTTIDSRNRNPLHMAARCNDITSFNRIWKEVKQLENPKAYLMQRDHRDATVFARAYLRKNKNFNIKFWSDKDEDTMFDAILKEVKEKLTEEDKKAIMDEIDRQVATKNKPEDRNTRLKALVDAIKS